MRAALVFAIICALPVTLLAQSSRAAEPRQNPSLLEVAARIQRIVEAHEAAPADEKPTGTKTGAKVSHKPKSAARPAVRGKAARRIGLSWRVTLVWPEELREIR